MIGLSASRRASVAGCGGNSSRSKSKEITSQGDLEAHQAPRSRRRSCGHRAPGGPAPRQRGLGAGLAADPPRVLAGNAVGDGDRLLEGGAVLERLWGDREARGDRRSILVKAARL